MRSDAAKDPASNPNALHARLLINQVWKLIILEEDVSFKLCLLLLLVCFSSNGFIYLWLQLGGS